MSDELTDALRLAERVLDRPYIDPDGDICLLSRQFLRARDEVVALREHAAKCMRVSGCAEARAEALEDAAMLCERFSRYADDVSDADPGFAEAFRAMICVLIEAIRALKDKP